MAENDDFEYEDLKYPLNSRHPIIYYPRNLRVGHSGLGALRKLLTGQTYFI